MYLFVPCMGPLCQIGPVYKLLHHRAEGRLPSFVTDVLNQSTHILSEHFFSFLASRRGDLCRMKRLLQLAATLISRFPSSPAIWSASVQRFFPFPRPLVRRKIEGKERRRSPGKLCPRRHQHRKVATRRAPCAAVRSRVETEAHRQLFLASTLREQGGRHPRPPTTRRRSYSTPYKF